MNTNKTKTKYKTQKTEQNEEHGTKRKAGSELDGLRITYGSCNLVRYTFPHLPDHHSLHPLYCPIHISVS